MQWFLQVNRNQMGERWLHFYEAITQPLEGQGKEPRPGDGVVSDFPPCHPPPRDTAPCLLLVTSPRQPFQGNGAAALRYFTAGKQLRQQHKGCGLKDIASLFHSFPLNIFYNQWASIQLLCIERTHTYTARESGPEIEGGAETKEMIVQTASQGPPPHTLPRVELLAVFPFIPITHECQPCISMCSALMTQWWKQDAPRPRGASSRGGRGTRH